ncbi:hypothetical protein EDM53_02355 [Rickettsiales endosymbiont of Peranema trichophorum]|uniref:hypothetical protein n=1 Tax=Rickettsiales endosymbiont of Peranema trichophorum TaxID=2486577 RepID=UPI00102367E0|nr:hypothetical protein [Rickettsiales endosymbiont of Peranema trichophorum]RZI47360.1 hypothetical protein EDM53_02355 [Rickettsiales endosymbiont of Peranema trichophorum]
MDARFHGHGRGEMGMAEEKWAWQRRNGHDKGGSAKYKGRGVVANEGSMRDKGRCRNDKRGRVGVANEGGQDTIKNMKL